VDALPIALLETGGLITAVGAVAASAVTFTLRGSKAPPQSDSRLRAAVWWCGSATVSACGLTLLFLGLAIGYAAPRWGPAAALALLVASAAMTWYFRRRLHRLREGAPKS